MAWIYVCVGAVTSIFGAGRNAAKKKAQIKAQNMLNEGLAKDKNRVSLSTNKFAAAKGALARYMQSANNNNILAAGGQALEQNLVNERRRIDAQAGQTFDSRIKDAEQLGSQAAAAAFSGVGGEVADMVSTSTRLMQQRVQYEAQKNMDLAVHDDARRAGTIAAQTVRSLDNSLILDSVDYVTEVPQRSAEPNVNSAMIYAGLSSLAGSAQSGAFNNVGASKQPASTTKAPQTFARTAYNPNLLN